MICARFTWRVFFVSSEQKYKRDRDLKTVTGQNTEAGALSSSARGRGLTSEGGECSLEVILRICFIIFVMKQMFLFIN